MAKYFSEANVVGAHKEEVLAPLVNIPAARDERISKGLVVESSTLPLGSLSGTLEHRPCRKFAIA